MTLCPRGQPHPAEFTVTTTHGHPWHTTTCQRHLDLVTRQMTVKDRPPRIEAIREDKQGALFGDTP